MPDTAVHELIASIKTRLREMADSPARRAPAKKLRDAIDPHLRDDVLSAVEDLRIEDAARQAIAASVADQAAAREEAMTEDLDRLLKLISDVR
jgi:hypothetical protein